MAEWRVAEVVGEADGFGEVGVDVELIVQLVGAGAQVFADGTPDFGDFDRVGQARSVEVVFAGLEHLGL